MKRKYEVRQEQYTHRHKKLEESIKNPLKTLKVALFGPKTDGKMVPDIPLNNQRPAKYMFEELVKKSTKKIEEEEIKEQNIPVPTVKEQKNEEEIAVK